MNWIKLFKPNVQIPFCSDIAQIQTFLPKFNVTSDEDRIICHGEAMLTKDDPIAVHFYFDTDTGFLTHLAIHTQASTLNDTLPISFERKQKWLEDCYGKPYEYREDKQYPESIWKLERFILKHFIIDRFGEEEGILFLFEAINRA